MKHYSLGLFAASIAPVIAAALVSGSAVPASAQPAATKIAEARFFPASRTLTHAEDGVILPDGRVLVGDWDHGLVTIAPDGTVTPFGDFAAAGFRSKPDPLWNSPNGVSFEPDGRHVLVADITGGHIYRVDTVTEQVGRIYDHPFGVNAAVRDPSGAIWFTQSTENAAGAESEARMFAAADKPLSDGSVWRIAPEDVGKPDPKPVKLVAGLDFANGIVFDAARGRLYVAEIVASRILSFAVDPATGALSDRKILAQVTTPDNLELAADGMLWAASPFANAVFVINPDTGASRKIFEPAPQASAMMVAELERRQAAGEPLLSLLGPDLWGPMPGLITGVILSHGDGPAYVSGLGNALVKIDASALATDATPIANAQQLEEAIAESHRALEAILNGDPSRYLALFADRDDITLGNPFGPFGQGRAAVAAMLANAANKYQRGTARVERVALYGDANFVCLVEIEHDRAQLSGRDDYSEFSVRVTSIYERIGEQWKLVHRHADPITTARSAQSVIGK